MVDVGEGLQPRQIEALVGRQKLKKSFQYEVKWKNYLPKYNSWVPREFLEKEGFNKLIQKFDDHEASREGLGYRELTPSVIRKHFEDVGLDGDIADHTPMGSLSGGQLVKVVIAGAMWNNPHLLVLDEPTNYLDRDSLGGLAVAIRDWTGGVVMISHNNELWVPCVLSNGTSKMVRLSKRVSHPSTPLVLPMMVNLPRPLLPLSPSRSVLMTTTRLPTSRSELEKRR